jgi:hypothetical protein
MKPVWKVLLVVLASVLLLSALATARPNAPPGKCKVKTAAVTALTVPATAANPVDYTHKSAATAVIVVNHITGSRQEVAVRARSGTRPSSRTDLMSEDNYLKMKARTPLALQSMTAALQI